MANKSLPQFTEVFDIQDTDIYLISRGGVNKRISGENIKLLAKPYKSYVALLTQTSTNAPIPIVLENTIGAIVWSYDSTGSYVGTLTSAFTADKTFVICNSTNGTADDLVQAVTPFGNTDDILVYSWNTGTLANGILVNTPIEIRVYP